MKKKTYLRRLMSAALAGVMVMGMMTGCGSNDSGTGSDADTPKDADTQQGDDASDEKEPADSADGADGADNAGSGAAGIDGWEPFAENVTLKIPVYDRGAEGVPAIGENYWEKWIQENFGDAYNITMEFVPITRTDVLTSYALLAGADDLPTILMEYDYPKLAQWADEGYLATYDLDQFAEIAPTYYQRMVDNGQLQYTNMNDECYFVLAERPYYNTNYTFVTFYRQDWLEKIGLDKYPNNWADEKAMLQKLVDEGISEHPWGGHMASEAGVDQNYAFRTYPEDEETWATVGHYAIPALSSEAQKKFLQRENELYNLGFKNPEYYITDVETDKADFINGKTLFYAGYISADMDFVSAFYEQNPDGKLAVKVSENVVDEAAGTVPYAFRSNNPFGMMIGFSSQASEDEIKAAMMYMEWMTQEDNLFTMQWGVEGEHYEMVDGLPSAIEYKGTDKTQGFNNNKDYWCVTIESRNAGTIEDVIAASAPKNVPQDFTQQIIDNYNGQVELAKSGYAVVDCNYSVVIASEAEYQATLLSLYTEYRDKLTMCDPSEFDALYDDLSKKYLDAGYQAIIDERKAAYEAGQYMKTE